MLLSDKYPFLTNYFTELLNSTKYPLPQSLIFYGNDLDSQYVIAKEIARLLNCRESKTDDCNCLNCKWIRENTHPAVLTISKVDNKPADDDSNTVISIKQACLIKEMLVTASEFHRVFIFCDKNDDGSVAGLNFDNFQAEAANSLLKIIEEPNPNITFIFLSRNLDDIIPTIISRSQCFFVPSMNKLTLDYSLIQDIFAEYWNYNRANVFDLSQKLADISKSSSVMSVLDAIQNYMLAVLKSNPSQTEFIEHINIVEDAKLFVKSGIKQPLNVFDDLCLKLIK